MAPGPLTLVYPKWIPGEHGPTGPIDDFTGVIMSVLGANDKPCVTGGDARREVGTRPGGICMHSHPHYPGRLRRVDHPDGFPRYRSSNWIFSRRF